VGDSESNATGSRWRDALAGCAEVGRLLVGVAELRFMTGSQFELSNYCLCYVVMSTFCLFFMKPHYRRLFIRKKPFIDWFF
jgi:hypothetical protein